LPHIVIREAAIAAVLDKVALDKHLTAEGQDFYKINPQASAPALALDDGEVLTENTVILQYLAALAPQAKLAPREGVAMWRLREMLNFIATELHKGFSPLFRKPAPELRESLVKNVLQRLKAVVGKVRRPALFNGRSVHGGRPLRHRDPTLGQAFELDLGPLPNLMEFTDRVRTRPHVQETLDQEGLPGS
jgi:glutathione S-transferase